jgi:hypothetical protein
VPENHTRTAAEVLRRAGRPPANIGVDLTRVRTVLNRIAADVDEFARARRSEDLDTATTRPDRHAERRRRLAEPDLDFRAFCSRRRLPAPSTPQLERAWDAYQAERHRCGETKQRAAYSATRSGPADRTAQLRTPFSRV